jgi:hypothetical protein
MPYINDATRKKLAVTKTPETPGELNFLITLMIQLYASNKGPMTYTTINDIIGALEGAKLEFYRRIAVPYEDKKIKENGDVYITQEKKG